MNTTPDSTEPSTAQDDSTVSRPPLSAVRTDLQTDVPDGVEAVSCGYCGRPFTAESYLVLHHGLAHPDDLTPAEREAFQEAYREENAELKRFRIIALGLLVLLYFGFLFTFAVVT